MPVSMHPVTRVRARSYSSAELVTTVSAEARAGSLPVPRHRPGRSMRAVRFLRGLGLLRDESGQVLVLTAIGMLALMGCLGIATEVGLIYHTRQTVQIAADAGATAAALDYLYNNSVSHAQAAGKAATALNGYTDGSGGVTVTINMPPSSGPVISTGYAESIVTGPYALSFLRYPLSFFGISNNSVNVTSRAVAGTPGTGSTCVWLLASTGVGLNLQGSYDIQAPQCGIYVNSSSTNAVSVTGNGGILNAKYLDIVGSSVGHQTSPTPVTTNTAPRRNPWGNLTGPTTPNDCSITSALTTITASNVISVSGSASNSVVCFTSAVTLSNVTLPGASSGVVYLFEDGVTLSGTVTLGSAQYNAGTGTFTDTLGAVMDIQNGTFDQANAILNIYAPTAGTYNGVAILQPASNSNQLQVQFGSGNQVLDGYIFAPSANVYLQDSGGGITATGIVGDTMFNKTSSITIPSYDQANASTTPNRVVVLVE